MKNQPELIGSEKKNEQEVKVETFLEKILQREIEYLSLQMVTVSASVVAASSSAAVSAIRRMLNPSRQTSISSVFVFSLFLFFSYQGIIKFWQNVFLFYFLCKIKIEFEIQESEIKSEKSPS